MNRRIVVVALAVWLGIAAIAIANGTLRESVLIPLVGDAGAQILSVLLLAAAILAIQWLLVRRPWSGLGRRALLVIGASWTVGTIAFEFALGRLVLDMSWTALLQQYNIFAGKLWPIIPLILLGGLPLCKALLDRQTS